MHSVVKRTFNFEVQSRPERDCAGQAFAFYGFAEEAAGTTVLQKIEFTMNLRSITISLSAAVMRVYDEKPALSVLRQRTKWMQGTCDVPKNICFTV